MRAVVQRVTRASVDVGGARIAAIGRGLLVFVGVAVSDGEAEADALARKIAGLRVFDDAAGAMNLGATEIGASVLVVSQFTLLGDVRRGRRPSFVEAARGEQAERLYERVVAGLRAVPLLVATGRFGAEMAVELVNDGPVTILISIP
ncbi:D-aminoacyl-tRNA deacylase [Vulcanimicrobium alpinum]|uniref:D-aminoacyl-tRNA deacylase n=1 Tax=Vulcanimicrobium alpinum TaxID=3016050 RepID=A0AAN2C9P5_UNVUL|nr:D-aminoacyl-tRNA deacylase [Vulcanimicrobium alpinum]BDE06524.1 D-aminoacyl-tRNA deacylase [Vulcanimicrobium alpinum]